MLSLLELTDDYIKKIALKFEKYCTSIVFHLNSMRFKICIYLQIMRFLKCMYDTYIQSARALTSKMKARIYLSSENTLYVCVVSMCILMLY